MQDDRPRLGGSNDMSFRQPATATTNSAVASVNGSPVEDEALSRLKRTACVLCRKRKLKCDGSRPKCQTCNRLGHDCKYDEVRKKSGPKRGYVKALEARLAQVETQLKSSAQDGPDTSEHANRMDVSATGVSDAETCFARKGSVASQDMQSFQEMGEGEPLFSQADLTASLNTHMSQFSDSSLAFDEPMSWDMISLGLEEPLPTNEIAAELTEIFFGKVHTSVPIINRARFYANMHLAPNVRPPVCLRYAMWTLAAGLEDRFASLSENFYRRARKYLQLDEMRGFGEGLLTVHHCQAWILVSTHEFKNMHFPRAWMSTGRAVRLAQMLGLNRLDGQGIDVKQCLPLPKDWVEKEERRRTFWMAFWGDRCSSIGTGWPMTIDEQDIMTRLPASEEAFQSGRQERSQTLTEALDGKGLNTSGFATSTLLTALFGRNLIHLHRPAPDDREHDLSGKFWERHRKIDNILVNINMSLPNEQRIPFGLPDPSVIFLNMCIHTSVICLHQAAIFKADKYRMAPSVSAESKLRCLAAAGEIANIMRTVSHLDLSTMNPFMAFCLYVSARVFVQYLKARRNDQHILASLDFLLRAMHVMKRKNGLTESFIAQLDLDMETAGLPNPNFQGTLDLMLKKGVPVFPRAGKSPSSMITLTREDSVKGSPLPTNDQSQSAQQNYSGRQMPRPPGPMAQVLDAMSQQRFSNNSISTSPDTQEINLPYMKQRTARPMGRSLSGWDEAMPPSSIGVLDPTFSSTLNNDRQSPQTMKSPQTLSDTATEILHRSPPLFDNESVPQQRQNSYHSIATSWSNMPGLTSSASPVSNPFSKPSSHSNTTTSSTPSNTNITPPVALETDYSNTNTQFFRPASIDLPKVPQGWEWPSTGLTPLPGTDEWEKMLSDMGGWDPNAGVRPAEPWNIGRGPY